MSCYNEAGKYTVLYPDDYPVMENLQTLQIIDIQDFTLICYINMPIFNA